MIDATRLRQLIRAATPGPLRINRYDNVSDINYQLQSGWHAPGGGLEPQQVDEDYAIVANIRDDECPRAKPTAELILELYNHAEELTRLQEELDKREERICLRDAEQRKVGALAALDALPMADHVGVIGLRRRIESGEWVP